MEEGSDPQIYKHLMVRQKEVFLAEIEPTEVRENCVGKQEEGDGLVRRPRRFDL